jgi:hypothetical protein
MVNAEYVGADWRPKFVDYLAPVVHDRHGVQPDGHLGDQALGQAHDDG